ncbi:SRPBCC domain-containing protein [Oceanobacillus sp. CAU 1775]
MTEYGTLHESDGRYILKFQRNTSKKPEEVFSILTNPSDFCKWYPFATGEMDIRLGGEIAFDDGEGSTYSATITELEKPFVFGFREVDDLVNISLKEDNGCSIIFTHTFANHSWAVPTAAGWHRCLDVFIQIVNGKPIEWKDNAEALRKRYREAFNMQE